MADRSINLSGAEREEIVRYLPASSKLRTKIERAGKRIKVSSARGKGMSFQKTVCRLIADLIEEQYIPGDDESPIASRNSGGNGTDIILRGNAKKKFQFSVECKAQEQMNLVDTVKQAAINQQAGTDWLVVHRRKALPVDLVILSWEAFAKLWRGV